MPRETLDLVVKATIENIRGAFPSAGAANDVESGMNRIKSNNAAIYALQKQISNAKEAQQLIRGERGVALGQRQTLVGEVGDLRASLKSTPIGKQGEVIEQMEAKKQQIRGINTQMNTLNDMNASIERNVASLKNAKSGFTDQNRQIKENMELSQKKVKEDKRFKGENLSVMFVAMAVQKSLNSMLQPAMEASGVMEIIGSIFLIFFLPAMLLLVDPLLSILDAVDKIPDAIKEPTGLLVMLASAALGITAFAANLGLLANVSLPKIATTISTALGPAFTAIGPTITAAIASLGVIGIAAIAAVFILIIANIDGFVKMVSNLFSNIITLIVKELELGVELILFPIKLVLGLIKGLITGNFDDFWKAFQDLFTKWNAVIDQIKKTVTQFADDFFGWIKGALDNINTWIKNTFGVDIAKIISDVFNGVNTWVKNTFGVDILASFTTIGNGIKTFFDGIWTWIKGFVNGIIGTINNLGIPGVRITPLASGGIVTRPTLAMIGEAGPEAVVPLGGGSTSFGSLYVTNNIQAEIGNDYDVDALAEKLGPAMYQEFQRRSFA